MKIVLLSFLAAALPIVAAVTVSVIRRARDRRRVRDLLEKIVGSEKAPGSGGYVQGTDRWNGFTANVAYGALGGVAYYMSHIKESASGKLPKWTYEARLRLPDSRIIVARWTDRAYPGELGWMIHRAPPAPART